jgi:hypothetical protein
LLLGLHGWLVAGSESKGTGLPEGGLIKQSVFIAVGHWDMLHYMVGFSRAFLDNSQGVRPSGNPGNIQKVEVMRIRGKEEEEENIHTEVETFCPPDADADAKCVATFCDRQCNGNILVITTF